MWQVFIYHRKLGHDDINLTTRAMSDYDALMAFTGQFVVDLYGQDCVIVDIKVQNNASGEGQ